jgi:hypothetical protein
MIHLILPNHFMKECIYLASMYYKRCHVRDPQHPHVIILVLNRYYDEWRPCNILEVKSRSAEDIAAAVRAGSGSRRDGEYDLNSHGYMYYIHYSDWDRRMDEWITRERLSIEHPGSSAATASGISHTATPTVGESKTIAATDHGGTGPSGSGAHASTDGVDAVDADEAEDGDEESKTAANTSATAATATATATATGGATVAAPEGRGKSKGKSKGKGRGKTKGKSKDSHSSSHSSHDTPSGGNSHGHGNFTDADIKAHEAATKVKNIDVIVIGKYVMPTWYYSPFPEGNYTICYCTSVYHIPSLFLCVIYVNDGYE